MNEPIPWDLLSHAYGIADDVPVVLNELISTAPNRRSTARFALTGNVYHQGTRYSATYPTCKILTHLVSQPDTPEKDQIWELIRAFCD